MSKVAEPITVNASFPHCDNPLPPTVNDEKRVCPSKWSQEPSRTPIALDEDVDWSNVT